ncbi:translation initiation factor IF-2, partial [Coemansia sp. RSA 1358]
RQTHVTGSSQSIPIVKRPDEAGGMSSMSWAAKYKEKLQLEAKEMAKRKEREISERQTKEMAEQQAKEMAEKKLEQMAERKWQEMVERKAKELAELKARIEGTLNAAKSTAERRSSGSDISINQNKSEESEKQQPSSTTGLPKVMFNAKKADEASNPSSKILNMEKKEKVQPEAQGTVDQVADSGLAAKIKADTNAGVSTSSSDIIQNETDKQISKPVISPARFLFAGKRPSDVKELPAMDWAARYKEKLQLEAREIAQRTSESKQKTAANSTKRRASSGTTELAKSVRDIQRLAKKSLEASRMDGKAPVDFTDIMDDSAGVKIELEGPKQDIGRPSRKKEKPDDSFFAKKKRSSSSGSSNGTVQRQRQYSDRNATFDDGEKNKKKRKLKLPKKGQEITLPLTITVDGLAKLLDVPNDHLLRKMSRMGMDKLANNYLLSNEEAANIALEYNVVPIIPEDKGPELYPRPIPEDMSAHPLRPPIVTIMGHVDHGKTTLLDTLRNSSITATEAGGITQHIGAFSVELKGGQTITFLDTPGHAAFSAMRARGANATDIVVLVVAADDGVMPQTKEAIQHAQDADVPIIVAINKCDKPGVDPQRIQEGLLQYGIQTESLGGDIQAVEISALKGTGVEELSENIVTLAEVLDLRAEVDIPVQATVIESQLEKGRGNIATALVKRGTLKTGDIVVAGATWCKIRSMTDDRGKVVKSAGPACPVRIMGWKDIPKAGDMVLQAESEDQAKSVVNNRIEKRNNRERLASLEAMNENRREANSRNDQERVEEKAYKIALAKFKNGTSLKPPEKPAHMLSPAQAASRSAENDSSASNESRVLTVPVVIKGDVSGTVEAVASSLKKIPSKKIQISIISTGVGPVTESDVTMAGSGGDKGVIIAFNVKADKKTLNVAKRENVEVISSRIIYKLLEDVEKLLVSRLPPLRLEEVQGEAIVQETFDITLKNNNATNVAGCRVTVGSIIRANRIRVMRNGSEAFAGEISSLKNVKHDITEATKGQEFGVSFSGFENVKSGDIIQSLRYKDIPQNLE